MKSRNVSKAKSFDALVSNNRRIVFFFTFITNLVEDLNSYSKQYNYYCFNTSLYSLLKTSQKKTHAHSHVFSRL
tara:strand:+ start:424 stop:645 length:222 start_codon:yes stop_codon:yes gene_type:complete